MEIGVDGPYFGGERRGSQPVMSHRECRLGVGTVRHAKLLGNRAAARDTLPKAGTSGLVETKDIRRSSLVRPQAISTVATDRPFPRAHM